MIPSMIVFIYGLALLGTMVLFGILIRQDLIELKKLLAN